MRVTINLATRPFADIGPMVKRLRIAMGVLAVVGIGLGFGLHALHSKAEAARAREHSLDGAIARVTSERRGYETMMRQPDNAAVLTESGNLNKLFDEKAFSWTLAMEDLETVLPGGVQVTTLEPVRDKLGRITLRLRVIGPRDRAVELVQNLEHSRHFLLPRIVGESSETNGAPGERLEPVSVTNRVNFDLLADYNPATLGDKPAEKKKSEPKTEHAAAAPSHPVAVAAHPLASPSPTGPGLRRLPDTAPSRRPLTAAPIPPPNFTSPAPARKPNPGGPK
jgi:type IV pilus assembly protein PilN